MFDPNCRFLLLCQIFLCLLECTFHITNQIFFKAKFVSGKKITYIKVGKYRNISKHSVAYVGVQDIIINIAL